jgi:predicted Rossmann fold flavoprotein
MAAGQAAGKRLKYFFLKTEGQEENLISTKPYVISHQGPRGFITAYSQNGRFLYSTFHRFFRDDLLSFLKKHGVETKIERGGRVFPASDDARDVVRAFVSYLTDNKVQIKFGHRVTNIDVQNSAITGVRTEKADYPAGAVILATGGSSYPATGSTGDGYRIAQSLGHTIEKLRPGLVPLIVEEVDLAKSMQGVSLRNVTLTAYQCQADEIEQ